MTLYSKTITSLLVLFAAIFFTACTTSAPQPEPEPKRDYCPTCTIQPVIKHKDVKVPECTQPVTVVTYRDSCSACNDLPVTVRSYGLSKNCR